MRGIPKPLQLLSGALLLVVTVVGLGAAVVRTIEGLRVTNLNYVVPWGLWVAFYIYFIGLSAGSFLLSTLVYVFGVHQFERVGRVALFSALIALIAGLMFVLIDLGHMERFWTVFVHRNLWSVLEIEIHFYVLYIIIMLAELWLLMRQDLIRFGQGTGTRATILRLLSLGSKDVSAESATRDRGWVKILGLIGIPTAIGVHGGTGAIFAVVKARPMWFGPLFPIIFIVSALVSGGALLTFITAFNGRLPDLERRSLTVNLGKLTAGILLFDLLLMWSEFTVGIYGQIPEHLDVMRMSFFGPFWWVFWLVQIAFGVVIPLTIIFWPGAKEYPRAIGFAGLMIFIGIIGVRLNIVIPALNLPILPGFLDAYHVIPAPTKAVPAYSAAFILWLGRLAVIAALASIAAFGAVIARRLRGETVGRLGIGATAVAALFLIVAALRWAGGSQAALSAGLPVSGLVRSPIGGLFGTQPLKYVYLPSPNEWLSSAGLIGLSIIFFLVGWNILPLESSPATAEERR